eukprot:TRINITY_DN4450_c0_g1_i3.p1 TRINITY_DN4450_c0_g1~~TRINITY_DN4450_c0_g1_i3.p1  ORF type:complete len:144 (+),score=42.98 TRINITY_DN4450_c0_g1_i3:212-643(+)
MDTLTQYLESTDDDVVYESAWVISNTVFIYGDEMRDMDGFFDVLKKFKQLLNCQNEDIREQAVRGLGIVASGASEGLRDYLVSMDVFIISNIAAGRADHIDLLVHEDIMPIIMNAAVNQEIEIRKEGVWVISNYLLEELRLFV